MTSDSENSIARTTMRGSVYSVAASAITLSLGFVRTILLLRLLLPEHYGVATLALFFVGVAAQIRGLGIDDALIHRKDSGDEILATYLTMRLVLVVGSLGLLSLGTPLIARFYPEMPLLPAVLYAYIGLALLKGVNTVQVTVLSKALAFRKLAITDVLSSVAMTVVAPYVAWRGWGVWSLVAEQLTGVGVRTVAIWLFYRQWTPRLGWDREIASWFWRFGFQVWMSGNLTYLLDRFDDFWTGTALGKTALGFYSQAYEFARYPRRVVANPILSVFFPAFARLQDDRLRLSRAFFRSTSLMVRFGGWFSLVFILTAPEFIGQVLGEKWLPMTLTFQLMILYTLLDPLALTAGNLLTATGHPNLIVRTRVLQAVVFIPAVIALSARWGIEGVAIAANLMIAAGAILLFAFSLRMVDYSLKSLLLWPMISMAVTMGATLLLQDFWGSLSPWLSLGGKAAWITVLYGSLLWLTEREQLVAGGKMIWGLMRPYLVKTGQS